MQDTLSSDFDKHKDLPTSTVASKVVVEVRGAQLPFFLWLPFDAF